MSDNAITHCIFPKALVYYTFQYFSHIHRFPWWSRSEGPSAYHPLNCHLSTGHITDWLRLVATDTALNTLIGDTCSAWESCPAQLKWERELLGRRAGVARLLPAVTWECHRAQGGLTNEERCILRRVWRSAGLVLVGKKGGGRAGGGGGGEVWIINFNKKRLHFSLRAWHRCTFCQLRMFEFSGHAASLCNPPLLYSWIGHPGLTPTPQFLTTGSHSGLSTNTQKVTTQVDLWL